MKQRIVTGLIAGAAFLGLLYLGGYWFTGLILILALIGFHEFIRMNKYRAFEAPSIVGFLAILYFVAPWSKFSFVNGFTADFSLGIWVLIFILLALTVTSNNKFNIEKASMILMGVIYISIGFHYMIMTRWLEFGLFWAFLLFSCIWLTDSGAYFTGRILGKHLLWPLISPKKTVEGAIGGIFFSIAAAIGFSLYSPDLLNIYTAVWAGGLISIVGQMGDLIQSAYKRVTGIKDTGNLLPGHGGVLDRCDSWLMVFPFVYFLNLL